MIKNGFGIIRNVYYVQIDYFCVVIAILGCYEYKYATGTYKLVISLLILVEGPEIETLSLATVAKLL